MFQRTFAQLENGTSGSGKSADGAETPSRWGLMSGGLNQAGAADTGLAAFVMLLRFHGVGADVEQLRHQNGVTSFGIPEMIRCARELGFKARAVSTRWRRLEHVPMPVIASLRGGGFLILGKVGEGKALVQLPSSPRPEIMTQAQFE